MIFINEMAIVTAVIYMRVCVYTLQSYTHIAVTKAHAALLLV